MGLMWLSNIISKQLHVASESDGCPVLAGSAFTEFDLANFAWAFGKAFSEMATSTFDYEHEVQQEFDLFMKDYLWRVPAREQVDPCLLPMVNALCTDDLKCHTDKDLAKL